MATGAYPAGASGEPNDGVTTEMPSVGATSAGGESPASAHAARTPDTFAERPEIFVGAAFAGGLVAAKLLKRLRR